MITFVHIRNDNNNRLITLTEKVKIAILSFNRCLKNKFKYSTLFIQKIVTEKKLTAMQPIVFAPDRLSQLVIVHSN